MNTEVRQRNVRALIGNSDVITKKGQDEAEEESNTETYVSKHRDVLGQGGV